MSADKKATFKTNRRDLLKAGAALTIALYLPVKDAAARTTVAGKSQVFEPTGFVRIGVDDTVTIYAKSLEMGQGVYTGLATILAEELDADWKNVVVAGLDVQRFNNLRMGSRMGTGGSMSIAGSYEQMRKAGATARALLVSAAADRWRVPGAEITVTSGKIEHAASGRSARFGELVAAAARLPVPQEVKLKDPATFKLIGKDIARVDVRAKSNGTARFTQDLAFPGMLTAAVVHPPRFGAKVKSFDASRAQALRGVQSIVQFETPVRSGVAVLASDFWTAKKAAEAIVVEWDESAAFKRSSADLFAEYREIAQRPGASARKEGDVDAAMASAAHVVEATYEFPFLAHAAMETLDCVVRLGKDDCEVWNGEQSATNDQAAIAAFLGLSPAKVQIHALYAGGSFGRRANQHSDYVLEAVSIAKAAGVSAPVKMLWTREQDMRAGYYRAMYVHALKAGIDKNGNVIAWQHRIVGQSIASTRPGGSPRPIDNSSVEGAADLPYGIPNLNVELHTTHLGVPIQYWRSVGHSHTAFATEAFLDDVARALKKDPYELRRELLGAEHARHLAVLDALAQKSGWKNARPRDEVWGLALHESFNTVVGQVVQLKRTSNGLKLHKVICVVDCGTAINPNIIAMQMESGIGYGLAAALNGAITLEDGKVQQSNYHDYPALRMSQMPEVEVHIVPSTAKPSGVGEPGTPVIGPALANAIASATGKAVHTLPLSTQGIRLA